MTVKAFAQKLGLTLLAGDSECSEPVEGCYVCDLLSMAMGRVSEHDAWITVQTNINIVAIAVLTGASLIIIPEGLSVEQMVLEKAEDECVTIYSSGKTAYALAVSIGALLET